MDDLGLLVIARRIEGVNARALTLQSEAAAKLYPELNATALAVADGVAAFAGKDSPISYAVGLGLNGPVTLAHVQQIADFYASHGVAPRVDVCPLADKSLLEALRIHNFQLHEFVNVLIRAVEISDTIAPPPDGITIRQAEQHEGELWTRIVGEGFIAGPPLAEELQRFGMTIFHCPTTRSYFAMIGNEIAGAGALFMCDGFAALTLASTRPAFRSRGVHTALIRARLRVAQELNCDMAGLYAVPGNDASQRNAERHFFHLAYTKAVMKKR